jgi:hypothetical protein
MKRMPTLSIQEYEGQWWWIFEAGNGKTTCSCPHRSALSKIMNVWEKMKVGTAYHVELQVRESKAIEKRALQFLSARGYLVTKLKGVAR